MGGRREGERERRENGREGEWGDLLQGLRGIDALACRHQQGPISSYGFAAERPWDVTFTSLTA